MISFILHIMFVSLVNIISLAFLLSKANEINSLFVYISIFLLIVLDCVFLLLLGSKSRQKKTLYFFIEIILILFIFIVSFAADKYGYNDLDLEIKSNGLKNTEVETLYIREKITDSNGNVIRKRDKPRTSNDE